MNCYYQCKNCGFEAHWEESDDNQADYSENSVGNLKIKRVNYKEN